MGSNKDLASKIKKSKRYAQELKRVRFDQFKVKFRGDHGVYLVFYDGQSLTCACPFFKKRKTCSHIMAVKKILTKML